MFGRGLVWVLGFAIVSASSAWAYPPPSLLTEMQPPSAADYYRLWEVRNLRPRPMGKHMPDCPPPPLPDPIHVEGTIHWGVGMPTDCDQCGKYPKHGRVGPYGTFLPGSYYLEEPKILMPMPAFGPAF